MCEEIRVIAVQLRKHVMGKEGLYHNPHQPQGQPNVPGASR
jgi:hypothetical protein